MLWEWIHYIPVYSLNDYITTRYMSVKVSSSTLDMSLWSNLVIAYWYSNWQIVIDATRWRDKQKTTSKRYLSPFQSNKNLSPMDLLLMTHSTSEVLSETQRLSPIGNSKSCVTEMLNLPYKLGQIGHKWDNSGIFKNQFQSFLARQAKMYWKWS